MCLLNLPLQAKLTAVEIEDSVPGCIDKSRFESLMCILTVSLQLTEQSELEVCNANHVTSWYSYTVTIMKCILQCISVTAETEMSVEHTWVLGLALKALNYILSVSWTVLTFCCVHHVTIYLGSLCSHAPMTFMCFLPSPKLTLDHFVLMLP